MSSNYTISNNNNKILLFADNLKLCFSILTQLLTCQIELLMKLTNDMKSLNNIPNYFISYSKDYIINTYHIYIKDNNVYIMFNGKYATDDNAIQLTNYFKNNYEMSLYQEDFIKLQEELDNELEKLNKIKKSYYEDKKIFLNINNDIKLNKFNVEDINSIFKKKYQFFIDNLLLIDNNDKLILLYEKIL